MAYRREPFAVGEWYHCYSRGVDKRVVFEDERDCERFLETLYIANDENNVNHNNIQHLSHADVMRRSRGVPIVAIGAYCLMPNHFHMMIQEIAPGGISRFMHKLGTSYTMYFNVRNERVGNLFVKPFRSKLIAQDRYFRRIVQYIHLNPAEIYEPGWKSGKVRSISSLQSKIMSYPYSSYCRYLQDDRSLYHDIVSDDAVELLRENLPPLPSLLKDAAEYYSTLNP